MLTLVEGALGSAAQPATGWVCCPHPQAAQQSRTCLPRSFCLVGVKRTTSLTVPLCVCCGVMTGRCICSSPSVRTWCRQWTSKQAATLSQCAEHGFFSFCFQCAEHSVFEVSEVGVVSDTSFPSVCLSRPCNSLCVRAGGVCPRRPTQTSVAWQGSDHHCPMSALGRCKLRHVLV